MVKAKKGVSGVIAVVILIAIVLAASAMLWAIVNNIISDRLDEASSCLEVHDKIYLNKDWVCYNSTSRELLFSISVGNADIEKINVMISGQGSSSTIDLTNSLEGNDFVKYYGSTSYSELISAPGKNSGKSYFANLTGMNFAGIPTSIILYPVARGKRCQASDSITQIDDCSGFVF
jgi:flagellin-like protein